MCILPSSQWSLFVIFWLLHPSLLPWKFTTIIQCYTDVKKGTRVSLLYTLMPLSSWLLKMKKDLFYKQCLLLKIWWIPMTSQNKEGKIIGQSNLKKYKRLFYEYIHVILPISHAFTSSLSSKKKFIHYLKYTSKAVEEGNSLLCILKNEIIEYRQQGKKKQSWWNTRTHNGFPLCMSWRKSGNYIKKQNKHAKTWKWQVYM